MQQAKKYIVPIILFSVILYLFSYKLIPSFNFHPDFGRDINSILPIVQGKPTLIGPKTSFGGIYSGPYYYYFFAPILWLTGANVYSMVYFNLAIFLFTLIIFYILTNSLSSTLVVAFLPIYVSASRSPWNASTYFPFLLIFLALIYIYNFERAKTKLLLLGFLGGAIAATHPANLMIIVFSIAYLTYFLKRKINVGFFLLGVILAFSPLIFFELRHNFVMTRNTFVNSSYKTFTENTSVPYAISGKKNLLQNFGIISQQLSRELGVNFLIYGIFFIVSLKYLTERKSKFFVISVFVLFLLFAYMLRYQFFSHYLYPLPIFIVFTVSVILLKSRFEWLLLIILFFEILSFPRWIYDAQLRKPEQFEQAVNYVIQNQLIQRNESFNVLQIAKIATQYVPVGNEYRFFFRKNHFIPKSESEYNSSNTLLIFSEIKDFDITKLDSWEVNQFGKKYLQKSQKYKIGDLILYKINKI